MTVVATAGHVDHGKSTLVRALTGTDPDRLAEERRRGLTIDLGFAHTVLPSGREVGFVDVPGHSRYLHNMLAGAGGVAACLFVVDATEGWRAQSEEHLRILELLGTPAGVVAVTKADVAGAVAVAAVLADVRARVEGTFLAGAPFVAVDACTGTGLEPVRAALDAVVAGPPEPGDDEGSPRLWIDRAFTVAGAGPVVTGTLTGGPLAVGAAVEIGPGAHEARVRGLQAHGRSITTARPGTRVAVNLRGAAAGQLGRGQRLTAPGAAPTRPVVDTHVTVLPGGPDLGRRGAWHLHVGTAEQAVQIGIRGGGTIPAGGHGTVRLHLREPLPLVAGDPFVVRERGRDVTVAGGVVVSSGVAGPAPSPPVPVPVSGPEPDTAVAAEADRYLRALEGAPFTPPPPAGIDGRALRRLRESGRAAERDGVWFARTALDEAGAVVAGLLARSPEGVTVAAVRDALGASRRTVLPLLALLDASGVTRRRGDVRVGGPRLPPPR